MKKFIILLLLCACAFGIGYTIYAIYSATLHYPGGTIQERASVGYDWWNNYLSDLGRRRSWNGQPNTLSNELFDRGLYVATLCMIILFNMFPFVIRSSTYKVNAVVVGVLGIGSAFAYLGIAWYPLDVNYRMHTLFVRTGFISFWILSIVFAITIRKIPDYHNVFSSVMFAFALIFLVQISIMLFGPRAWSSPEALRLQVTAQKIIVGLQLFVMLVQIGGMAWYVIRRPGAGTSRLA